MLMAEITKLMGIGQFSSQSRLSVRMLRHYDAHGVLVPADVDPVTGYRRYAPAQLRDAADVRNLRDIGIGVSAIPALLAARGTPAWPSALRLQREALTEELRAAQGRLTLIDRMLNEGESTMSVTIERRTIPAMTVAALRATVPTYSDEGQLWERFLPILTEQGIEPTGPCGAIEHADEYVEHDVDLSVFVPVAPHTEVRAPVEKLELPERDCLVARVVGPYSLISQAHDLIGKRLTDESLSVARDAQVWARVFNLYLATPGEVSETELVTEVHVPLA